MEIHRVLYVSFSGTYVCVGVNEQRFMFYLRILHRLSCIFHVEQYFCIIQSTEILTFYNN